MGGTEGKPVPLLRSPCPRLRPPPHRCCALESRPFALFFNKKQPNDPIESSSPSIISRQLSSSTPEPTTGSALTSPLERTSRRGAGGWHSNPLALQLPRSFPDATSLSLSLSPITPSPSVLDKLPRVAARPSTSQARKEEPALDPRPCARRVFTP